MLASIGSYIFIFLLFIMANIRLSECSNNIITIVEKTGNQLEILKKQKEIIQEFQKERIMGVLENITDIILKFK